MKKVISSGSAFSLVEVTIALGIAGFCLVAIFGLVPIGLNSNQNSVELTAMAAIAADIASDLRTASRSIAVSPRFSLQIGSLSPQVIYFNASGEPTGPVGAGATSSGMAFSRYRATVGFSNSGTATMVRIMVTRPALADPKPSGWPSNFAGAFEAVTALDRS